MSTWADNLDYVMARDRPPEVGSQGTQGRAQFYSVIKKRREVSTKTERERSRVPVLSGTNDVLAGSSQ